MQKIYDEKYVDTIAVILEAKDNDLDMVEVDRRLTDSGFEQSKLWEWREWVFAACKAKNPSWLPINEAKRALQDLGIYDHDMAAPLQVAQTKKQKQQWLRKANKAIKEAKTNMRKMYGV